MNKKSTKVAVFISSGIGNTVMLVPLLKILKEKGCFITLVLNSKFIDEGFLISNNFPHDKILVLDEKKVVLGIIKSFDVAYLDYSSSSFNNLIIAKLISKSVIAMRNKNNIIPGVTYIKPELGIHSVVLNTRLIEANLIDDTFDFERIRLYPKINITNTKLREIPEKTIISVQVSSGNMKSRYKNWPIKYWVEFFDLVFFDFKNCLFLLIGDKNEVGIGEEILTNTKNSNLLSFIGKTNLKEASKIVNRSDFYIGLDSGFMHLAVAYDKPTFTMWGGSSYDLFSYHKFNPTKHVINYTKTNCHPCNAWLGRNVSRVKDPNNCPDVKCMMNLTPELVFNKFKSFMKNQKQK